MDDMEENLTNRELALAGIAKQLDEAVKTREFESQLDELTDEEREQLKRIKNAVGFINNALAKGPKGPEAPEAPEGTDTRAIAQQKTLGAKESEVDEIAQHAPGKVGRFELIEEVGKGGFATVWLARDPHLDRNVAIKILSKVGLDSAEVTSRFHREAKAAAVLNHPNIVPVFDSGIDETQRFIASAFCDGQDLQEWLQDQKSIDFRMAATIVSKLADAVEHAHRRGIIHRDLKPGNVMLENLPTDYTAEQLADALRITDFGLAKNLGSVDPLQTREGSIIGTPAYMSPEQADGHKEIDARTDVYSLGAMLYRLLTGNLPHQGKTHLDILLSIRQNEPVSPRQLKPAIPKSLEAICLKSLSQNPEHRYLTAHELSADLNRWLNGEVVKARNPSMPERFGKWCKRNPVLAFSILAISSSLALAVWQWSVSQENLTIANQQTARAEDYLDEMTGIIDGLLQDMKSESSLITEAQKNALVKIMKVQENLIHEESNEFSIQLNRLHAYRRMARIQQTLGDFDEAEKTYVEAAEWLGLPSEWDLPAAHPKLDSFASQAIQFYLDFGKNLYEKGDLELAFDTIENAREAFDTFRYLLTEEEQLLFEVYYGVEQAFVWKQMQEFDKSVQQYKKAVAASEQLKQIEKPLSRKNSVFVSSSILGLAQLHNVMGKPDEAVKLFEQASVGLEEYLQRYPGSLHLKQMLVTCDSNWSNSLTQLKQFDKVEPVLLRVLENVNDLVTRVPNSQRYRISLVMTHGKLSGHYIRTKRNEEGLIASQQAIDAADGIETSVLGCEVLLRQFDSRCYHLNELKRNAEMVVACEEGIELSDRMLEKFPNMVKVLVIRSKLYFKLLLAYQRLGRSEEFMTRIDDGFESHRIAIERTREPHDQALLRIGIPRLFRLNAVVLGDLKNWDAAIESAKKIVEHPDSSDATKYRQAIRCIDALISRWEKNIGENPEAFANARDMAMDWLELWMEADVKPKLKDLKTSRHFSQFRETDRWQKLLQIVSDSSKD